MLALYLQTLAIVNVFAMNQATVIREYREKRHRPRNETLLLPICAEYEDGWMEFVDERLREYDFPLQQYHKRNRADRHEFWRSRWITGEEMMSSVDAEELFHATDRGALNRLAAVLQKFPSIRTITTEATVKALVYWQPDEATEEMFVESIYSFCEPRPQHKQHGMYTKARNPRVSAPTILGNLATQMLEVAPTCWQGVKCLELRIEIDDSNPVPNPDYFVDIFTAMPNLQVISVGTTEKHPMSEVQPKSYSGHLYNLANHIGKELIAGPLGDLRNFLVPWNKVWSYALLKVLHAQQHTLRHVQGHRQYASRADSGDVIAILQALRTMPKIERVDLSITGRNRNNGKWQRIDIDSRESHCDWRKLVEHAIVYFRAMKKGENLTTAYRNFGNSIGNPMWHFERRDWR